MLFERIAFRALLRAPGLGTAPATALRALHRVPIFSKTERTEKSAPVFRPSVILSEVEGSVRLLDRREPLN